MVFICYSKCTTCSKARKYLDGLGAPYEQRDIKGDNPTYEELKAWLDISRLPVKRLFNTSGQAYRTLQLKDKLADMSVDECLQLLSTDGMLVKRPILVGDGFVLVGFKESEWDLALAVKRD
ncbi:MAG: arsenate reductase family protein [Coriobacteriia bacterium]|nr:arsenate reductase family protein [Coriobacteriia bacterium]